MNGIFVLGLPRSGTNCLGGVLHHLGVYMGENFQGPDEWNQKGHFQDGETIELHGKIVGAPVLKPISQQEHEQHIQLLKRFTTHPVWGVKSHLTQWFLYNLINDFPSIKLMVTQRPFSESVQSWMTRKHISMNQAFQELGLYQYMLTEALEYARQKSVTIFPVDYLKLVNEPDIEIKRIADFCGLPVTQEAINFVDPKLKRFGGLS